MALTKFNFNSFDLTTAASKGLAFNSSANGFTTGSSDSMILIKTITASSSANVSFVHGSSDVVLDNTYPVYFFDFVNIHPSSSGNENFLMNFSTDGGSNYNVTKTSAAFVSYNYETVSANATGYDTTRDLAQSTSDQIIASEISSDSDSGMGGRMYLFNPSSTTFVKHFMSQMVGTNDPGSNEEWSHTDIMSGYANTTSAINGVRFKFVSHNIDSGKIKLYGIKDS